MYRFDIYKSIAKDIAKRLKDSDVIDEETFNEINDNADNGQLTDIFDGVPDTGLGIYNFIAKYISSNADSDDNIANGVNLYICDVDTTNSHLFKKIGVYDDSVHFLCVTAEYLKNLSNPHDPSNPHVYLIRLLERIWPLIMTNSGLKDQIWNLIENGDPNKYVLVTNENPADNESKWRLYSFGYLLYCNNLSFGMAPALNFNGSIRFKYAINLISSAKYEQYFDIYELINESHYCDDILSRFLNMYHIIENLCYRRHLAKLSYGNIKRNAFVRKALKQFSNGSDKENQEIIEGIAELFPNLSTAIITGADFTPANKTFLLNEYKINIGPNPSNNTIAKVIYQLRNSIAHNKATELHFGYGNIDDYLDITDLIKIFIEKLEPAIIDLIGNNPAPPGNPHPLEYDKRSFDIY